MPIWEGQEPLWQKSYHDRLIRNWDHFSNVVRYIRDNPKKAALKPGEWTSGESPLAAAVEVAA